MKQKKLMAVVSVALLLCTAVGGTLAWVTAQTPALTNTFEVADIGVSITENFDNGKKENIQLTNNGDIPAYLRAAVIVGWEKDGSVVYDVSCPLPDLPNDLGAGWVLIDGIYYYTSIVEAKATTPAAIFTTAITEPERKPDGARLQVTILAEAIQADPREAIVEAWGEEVAKILLPLPTEPEGGGEG